MPAITAHPPQSLYGNAPSDHHEAGNARYNRSAGILPDGSGDILPPVIPFQTGSQPADDESARSWELPGCVRVAWLVVLGVLTPFVVCTAMAATCLLGRVAWVVAPIVGTWVSFGLARHCSNQPKPARYRVYIVTVILTYASVLLSAFLPTGRHSGGGEPSLAGAQAAAMGGLVLMLFGVSAVFWFLGVAFAFRGSGTGESPDVP